MNCRPHPYQGCALPTELHEQMTSLFTATAVQQSSHDLHQPHQGLAIQLERVAGIEPASSAWKAEVLPLNYTRKYFRGYCLRVALPITNKIHLLISILVQGGGFEPPKLARQIYSLIPLATREPLLKLIK